ncbi:TonB-dependent receptor [Exilibacterium tricleocarpae]|nr:TonB-dependent siderophore receptor [Exilibacterium tricleocarpae]
MIIIGNPIGSLRLNDQSSTASRLGLTALETPATIEIIDGSVMRARGYSKLSDAVQSLPGVVTGEHPTAPSTFSVRGFTRGQITVLRDGLWIGPSTMVMRPQNTFNLERVEVLRGPASVINGIGSVAGTVNAITRSAEVGMESSTNLLLGYGRYDSRHLGLGSQGGLGENAWFNVDISRYDTDGYVDRTDSSSTNLTGSLLWQPTEAISLKFGADYLSDDVGSYFGTPLVPAEVARDPLDVVSTGRGEVLDGAMRFRNYNVDDAVADSDQLFLRLDFQWQLNDSMTLKNTLYQFSADREWRNAEGYAYCRQVVDVCTQVGEIQRYYGYFLLDHDQDLLGNRLTVNIDSQFGGMESRFVAGLEAIDMDFERSRGFRRGVAQVPGDGVDAFNPEPGRYGPEELRGISPTDISTLAAFFGNALQVTDTLSLVTGLRHENLDLDRRNFNAEGVEEANGFSRQYSWWSWRIGAVYNFTPDIVGYAQYSNAKDPINSNVFLVNANQNFDLTDAKQWEVGLKAIWLDGKAESTLAYYDIERDDVFERFALDSATNVGGRASRGVEFSTTMRVAEQWRVGTNAAYTNAEFRRSANFQSLAGNTPPNVPQWTAALWTSYQDIADLPLEVGVSVHHVDDRFGDNPNTVTLKSYTLTNLFSAWKADNFRISARVENLFDEDYVPWADVFYLQQDDPGFIYANQLLLGSPRTYRLMFEYQIQ